MLRSMTGFGASEKAAEDFSLRVEVRAVNQRFLEMNFHMPFALVSVEDKLRKLARTYLSRGKVDFYIRFASMAGFAQEIRVNEALVYAYRDAWRKIGNILHVAAPDDVLAIASYPDVLTVEEGKLPEGFEGLLIEAAEEALQHLDAMRQQEGVYIGKDFSCRLHTLEESREALQKLAPKIAAQYRVHLKEAMEELLGDAAVDEARLIQEAAIYADKTDFTEELVRLKSHFDQFKNMLANAEEPVGRKLDFLVQEMNRETNTIGSKCNFADAMRIVISMKSELEKVREQVQNLE